ncbi:hypothetical protein CYMTET_40696 [Cymbomonas tetramitiformis]|uniref:Uncharacterized protein n=1 Tax=Cymbomonas tetramitiformis TaxID=36881 RepID=A0AAE0C7K5_9CHLO|nr:hypothetical protein CYMTET_40696 [Cymbomonas tetramitiformis]
MRHLISTPRPLANKENAQDAASLDDHQDVKASPAKSTPLSYDDRALKDRKLDFVSNVIETKLAAQKEDHDKQVSRILEQSRLLVSKLKEEKSELESSIATQQKSHSAEIYSLKTQVKKLLAESEEEEYSDTEDASPKVIDTTAQLSHNGDKDSSVEENKLRVENARLEEERDDLREKLEGAEKAHEQVLTALQGKLLGLREAQEKELAHLQEERDQALQATSALQAELAEARAKSTGPGPDRANTDVQALIAQHAKELAVAQAHAQGQLIALEEEHESHIEEVRNKLMELHQEELAIVHEENEKDIVMVQDKVMAVYDLQLKDLKRAHKKQLRALKKQLRPDSAEGEVLRSSVESQDGEKPEEEEEDKPEYSMSRAFQLVEQERRQGKARLVEQETAHRAALSAVEMRLADCQVAWASKEAKLSEQVTQLQAAVEAEHGGADAQAGELEAVRGQLASQQKAHDSHVRALREELAALFQEQITDLQKAHEQDAQKLEAEKETHEKSIVALKDEHVLELTNLKKSHAQASEISGRQQQFLKQQLLNTEEELSQFHEGHQEELSMLEEELADAKTELLRRQQENMETLAALREKKSSEEAKMRDLQESQEKVLITDLKIKHAEELSSIQESLLQQQTRHQEQMAQAQAQAAKITMEGTAATEALQLHVRQLQMKCEALQQEAEVASDTHTQQVACNREELDVAQRRCEALQETVTGLEQKLAVESGALAEELAKLEVQLRVANEEAEAARESLVAEYTQALAAAREAHKEEMRVECCAAEQLREGYFEQVAELEQVLASQREAHAVEVAAVRDAAEVQKGDVVVEQQRLKEVITGLEQLLAAAEEKKQELAGSLENMETERTALQAQAAEKEEHITAEMREAEQAGATLAAQLAEERERRVEQTKEINECHAAKVAKLQNAHAGEIARRDAVIAEVKRAAASNGQTHECEVQALKDALVAHMEVFKTQEELALAEETMAKPSAAAYHQIVQYLLDSSILTKEGMEQISTERKMQLSFLVFGVIGSAVRKGEFAIWHLPFSGSHWLHDNQRFI